MMARRSGETFVAGEQRSVERFGEGDVDRVIRRKIVPQIPNSRQKEVVWISAQREFHEVSESRATALRIDLTIRSIPANHLRDFNVQQIRRVQRLQRIE